MELIRSPVHGHRVITKNENFVFSSIKFTISKKFYLKKFYEFVISLLCFIWSQTAMAPQRFCQNCIQKHDCQRVYEQLGNASGPHVVLKTILAFLLPLVIFIVSLAVFEQVLAGEIKNGRVQIALSLLLALLATFICMLITRVINKKLSWDR